MAKDKKIKMKPCPFCGGEPFVEDSARNEQIVVIQCQVCFGEGPIGDTEAEAIIEWNTRIGDKD